MGKTGRWFRRFFTGKKENLSVLSKPAPTSLKPLKKRWSLRRSRVGKPEPQSAKIQQYNQSIQSVSEGKEVAAVKIQSFFRSYLVSTFKNNYFKCDHREYYLFGDRRKCVHLHSTGEESFESVEGIGEATGFGESSSREKANDGGFALHAGFGFGSGKNSRAESSGHFASEIISVAATPSPQNTTTLLSLCQI